MSYLSTGIQLLLLATIIAYGILLFRSRYKPKVIRRSALLILLAGIAVHIFGLLQEGFSEGYVTLFFRSLFLALKMFVYDVDLIDMENAQHTYLFLDLYFFVFYAALLTSVSAIIMLFGKRVTTFFSLLFRKKKFRHIFVGVNSRSEMIARGISGEEIAFIEFPSDNKEGEVSISSIIEGMSGEENKDGLSKIDNIVMLSAKRRLKPSNGSKNVFATIGLERLRHFVGPDTAFYILSENTEKNLDDLMALTGSEGLMSNTIHVCVPREGVSRYYKTTMKRTGTHFIYPSSLAVVELMKSSSCQPASLMRPVLENGCPTGAVEGGFNALVIGFGETGQAVTKFLYEFSSAVVVGGTPLPVNITVNDERIDSLMGPFVFDTPELKDSAILHYENFGTESSEFWNRLMERLDSLNYIAISMNDDASNLDLACTIFMYALKKRMGGLDNFRIVVRKRNTLSHEKRLVEKMNERAGREVIVCYGEYEKIFTPEMIISESSNGINRRATGLADRIAAAYTAVSGHEVDLHSKSESFHVKNHVRMELHQFISRANHVGSLSVFTAGESEVSEAALENLARMEHLRYSRYLAAHGYSFAQEDDDVYKTNHQICDWVSLTDEDRQYHRDMVLAQLRIINNG